MKKIPECSAVAEGPAAGDPAPTMQKLTYSGAPRSRFPKPPMTGEGSAGIPYSESSSAVQASSVSAYGD